ncbi:MAG: hypothetical protein H5U37_04395 [Caldisericia bacterium]|nr:hypothetical protein [Caldisericia bacterium]
MKRLLIILFFSILLLGFKEIKVKSVIELLNAFDEAQNLEIIKIEKISFERVDSSIKGFVEFNLPGENLERFRNFLNEKNLNIGEILPSYNRIYIKEVIKENVNFDFKNTFFQKFVEIFSSKNFYFILLIALIFYLLILPNL